MSWVESLKWIAERYVFPIFVTATGFGIQKLSNNKKEKQKDIPAMNTLYLKKNAVEKLMMYEERIKSYKYIIEFQRLDYGHTGNGNAGMQFERITYEKLMEEVGKQELFLIYLEKCQNPGLCLYNIMYEDGFIGAIDDNIVPTHIKSDMDYCFVCNAQKAPSSVLGTFFRSPVRYEIKNIKDAVFLPKMKKGRKSMRCR